MKVINFKEIESEIRKYWEENNVIERVIEKRKGKKEFFVLDGPPYVNALPHVGHIKTTTFKDVWSKLKLMKGFFVSFQPGFDCHGLPIETIVEKELGIKNKKEIIEFGVDKFIELCKSKAIGNEKNWLETYKKLGAWRGYFKPYLTLENYYIESSWYIFKKIFERGLVYFGEKAYFWCPRCQTALSGYEVTDSYANIKDPYIFVKFPIKTREKEYIVVFTTTPWTLVSNVAIAVHPEEYYVKVEFGGEKLILAEKRVDHLFKELLKREDYKILERFKGKELEGLEYLPVLELPTQQKINFRKIILSIPVLKSKSYKHGVLDKYEKFKEQFFDFVNANEGSGCVHVAPGHGQEDYYIGQHYNLPVISPVDDEGKFTEDAGKFKGYFVRDANDKIIEELKEKNLLLFSTYLSHSYPLCWRCKSPLIFRLTNQWFISIDEIKEKMLEENEKVRWLPSFGKERFRNWLMEASDWCISRQRFWGIPIPIWICENCNEKIVIGSIEELKKLSINNVNWENLDLHKNFVDKIFIKCNKCNGVAKRIPDIFDVWYDSGSSPFSSIGYPFIRKKAKIVDLIDESQDQIRGWFYTLMFVSVAFINKSPYKTVCMNGWVLDEKGQKMSKSLGNVIDGNEAIDKVGADLLRFYYCYGNAPWEQQNFSFKTLEELRRQFNILWNCFEFFQTYKTENWNFSLENLELEDKWIISRLNSLIKDLNKFLENFEFHKFGKSFLDFVVNEFSRFYIKKIRDRVWIFSEEKTKNAALSTIYYVLLNLAKLLAPVSPFISEKIYLELTKKEKISVFEEEYPKADKKLIDKKLEKDFEVLIELISKILSMRESTKIKLRWPLKEIVFVTKNKRKKEFLNKYKNILLEMTNSIEIRVLPNFDGKDYISEKFSGIKIFLSKEIDKEKALIREIIRTIQEKRKERKLNVWDKVVIVFEKNEIIERNSELIKKEVNASSIEFSEKLENYYSINFEDKEIKFSFKY